MKNQIFAVVLMFAIFLFGIPFNKVQSQIRTDTRTETGQLGDLNIRNFQMPTFLIWTNLTQRDIESILPRGATVKPEISEKSDGGVSISAAPATAKTATNLTQGKNKFLVTGITDLVDFGLNLGQKSTERKAGVPGFGKQGAKNPIPIDSRIKNVLNKLAEVIHNIGYAKKALPGGKPFPAGPLPDIQKIILQRNADFDPNKDPAPTESGRWVRYCEPTNPCPRPVEPIPEDVPDCAEEQAEVDRLLERIDEWNNNVATAEKYLEGLQGIKIGSDVVDGVLAFMVVFAIITCPPPIGWGAAIILVGSGISIVKVVKDLFDFTTIDLAIKLQTEQLKEMKRIRDVYYDALNDAYQDLRNCRTKAAEAEGRNTAAFQKFINTDLPAYYNCLKQRRCGRRWVPK